MDSSAGAGLKGGSMGDTDGSLEVVGLAGGFPELFLVLGIVTTLSKRASLDARTDLIAIVSASPVPVHSSLHQERQNQKIRER